MDTDGESKKLYGFDFWRRTLNGARLVVAPMVDQSELAWRLLSRRHGAQLCYTPMYHASVFVRDANYRRDALASCEEDRPLIIQFCANDPKTLLQAAKYAESHCEAVDLNLGCPQAIAKRGHYGAFLQDEWELLHDMVSLCARELSVPITCKIRIFSEVDKTVRYAKMLEKAGCQLLTVHGRTKEQKGANTGLADWSYIKAVKEAVSIPVYANGNIQYLSDVHRCLEVTGVEGVMSAEGNLHDPGLFAGGQRSVWDMAEQYLALAQQYPCPMAYIRGHIFKLLHHVLLVHTSCREVLGNCKHRAEVVALVKVLRCKSQPDMDRYREDPEKYKQTEQRDLPFPYWICQPYVRPTPEETEQRQRDRQKVKRPLREAGGALEEKPVSRNKLKKLRRNPHKKFEDRPEKFEKCTTCGNPKGLKCGFNLCKACCKKTVNRDNLDCPGHKLLARTKQQHNQENSELSSATDLIDGMVKTQSPDIITPECRADVNLSDKHNSCVTDLGTLSMQCTAPVSTVHLETYTCLSDTPDNNKISTIEPR